MGLQSKLFRSDPALEACLVKDASHILQGANGSHVLKIQSALSKVDNADIDYREIRVKRFGSSTANAVLSFKKKNKIINLSYQTQADNIVGKMTIAALDSKMVLWERTRKPFIYCGDPGSGSGTRATNTQFRGAFSQNVGNIPTGAGTPLYPANLNIIWQPTSEAFKRAGNRHLSYLIKAISFLKPFGINIISSGGSLPEPPFTNEYYVNPDNVNDVFSMRKAAENAKPGFPNALRIIPCPFEPGTDVNGLTHGGSIDGRTFQDFILVNVQRDRADQCVVIHEMVHATGLYIHDNLENESWSVYSLGSARSVLKPEHAERLSKAFFAR